MGVKKLVMIAAAMFYTLWGLGQNGTIKGTIMDAKTKETLIGASVTLQGTTKGTISDFDGNFVIDKVAKGNYNLIISYISYDNQIIRTEVKDEGEITINIELKPASLDIEEVKVVAKRRDNTEVAMISSLKAANLIVSGITAQQISKSQDKDAAEVIRRVPGITITDGRFVIVRGLVERYNSVMLNGATAPSFEADKRSFSFDAIPSGLIDNILIYKSPAPELPADFAGAAINVETKSVADENSLVISYGTKYVENTTFNSDFQTYKGGKTDWLGFSDHSRDIPSAVPSKEDFNELYVWHASDYFQKTEKLNNIAKSFSNNWTTSSKSSLPDQNLSLALQRRFVLGKISIGNITALNFSSASDLLNIKRLEYQNYSPEQNLVNKNFDYHDNRYKESAKLGLIHNWNILYGNNQKLEFRNFINQMGNKTTNIRNGVNYYNVETLRLLDLKYETRFVYSGQLAGEQKFNNNQTKINWMAGYGYTKNNQPDNRRLTYVLNDNDQSDRFNQYYLELQAAPNAYMGGRLWLDMKENVYDLKADLEHHFLLFGNENAWTLKAGLLYEEKSRAFNNRLIGVVAKSQVPDSIIYQPVEEIFDHKNFFFDQTPPYNQHGISYQDNTNAKNSYKAHDQLIAAYVGLKIPITSKINLYGGVRVEKFERLITALQEKTENAETNLDITSDTINIYPSANLTYNINEKNLLRASYGKTVNRPEFREMSNFAYEDFEMAAIIHGSDSLTSAYIENYDLRYEWYPSNGEIVSIGAFYKDFNNPIEVFQVPAGTGYDFQPQNTQKAYSMGLEIDVRKQFLEFDTSSSFLRYLKDLTLIFNTSFIKSEINTTEKQAGFARDKKRIMQGQSPYIANLGMNYQNQESSFSLGLNYNRIGKRIAYVGVRDTPNTWELPRNSLDLMIEKGLGKRISVKAGVKDLLKEDVRFVQYWGSREELEMDTQSYTPNRNYSIALIVKL
ncbi:MAG TPA: TonB-dependent receptor [Prolixibacteraceae bacterium]|nr:TonB-dependent receptor [Prolixibacteraceae bacterium]